MLLSDNETLRSVFWMTGRQRALCQKYGDVMVFDSTYQTNTLCLPLACFVGITGNGRTVLLACALITDETTDTYDWVFGKLVDMAGAPTVIMTDQDLAIITSIEAILPATTHKLCTWHMNKNLVKNLGGKTEKRKFALGTFSNLIFNAELSEIEFEVEWGKLKSCFENDSSKCSSVRMRYLNSL